MLLLVVKILPQQAPTIAAGGVPHDPGGTRGAPAASISPTSATPPSDAVMQETDEPCEPSVGFTRRERICRGFCIAMWVCLKMLCTPKPNGLKIVYP